MALAPNIDYQGKVNSWTIPPTNDRLSINPPFYGTGEVLTLTINDPGKLRASDRNLTVIMRQKSNRAPSPPSQ